MTVVSSAPEQFDARKYTRSASRAYSRRQTKMGELLLDLYNAVLGIAVVVALAGSTVYAMREQLLQAAAEEQQALVDERWTVIPPGVFMAAAGFGALAAVVLLGTKLGPVSVNRPESLWWLSLPVARRPLVVGTFRRRLVLLTGAAALIYAAVSLLMLLDVPAAGHVAGAVTFGILAAFSALLAAVLQLNTGARSRTAKVLVLAALVPASALLPAAATGTVWPVAAAVVLLIGAWLYVSPRLGDVPGADLARGGAVTGHAGASVFFMDTNELARALGGTAVPSRARPVAGGLFSFRPRGPAGALLQADTTAFLRTPAWWFLPVLWLVLALSVLLVQVALPVLLQLAAVLVAGCAVASSLGGVARQTSINPAVDRLLPLGAATVKSIRMVMPATALILWMGLLTSAMVVLGVADWPLVALGALAGIGIAGGTLRGAYRPVPDWSQPPVETPFGPVPRQQLAGFARGADAATVALLPVLLAIYLGHVPVLLFAIQAVVSIGAWISGMVQKASSQ